MKRSKEEIKKRISEEITDNELSISLLEDIEDSMQEGESTDIKESTEYKDLENKYNELVEKYKERFLEPIEKETKEKEEIDETNKGLEEKKEIDIKEI